MARHTFLAVGLISMLALLGCTKGNDAVVVHVFRDPSAPVAPQVTRAIERFHAQKMRVNGRLIMLNADPQNYPVQLADIGRSVTPDLVFLNSRADADKNPALQRELSHAIELGAEGRRCLVFIPSWVSGEELAASRMFMNFLVTSGELW